MSRQGKLAALASTGVTKTELDNIDGGTARGTTAIADGDGVLINDAGTMRMTSVETMATYMGTKIGGGLEFIASTDASDVASVSFTGFDSSKYDSYVFTLGNVLPATDGTSLCLRMSVDSGSNYLSASDSYTVGSNVADSAGDANKIKFMYSTTGNAALDGGFTADIKINFPHLNSVTYAFGSGIHSLTNGSVEAIRNYSLGKTKAATVVNAIQFLFASGNIASGTFTMYGRVNS